ncbi:hypothetical protein B0J13DRAFT_565826 [Dactylonectria estremocensis]|uniref:Uncharacterized protein n=1 Tax=Dactylonectria estremocensis TaxID=1079267 RepID=A0A9P9DTU8_9HYPO|nr:hypothetical protein B0J13DRAFT_565826 [Dactylonectria estremocensis]
MRLTIRHQLDQPLSRHATIAFERIVHLYPIFGILAAFLGGLSLSVLTSHDFHRGMPTAFLQAAAFSLTSTIVASVAVISFAAMLLFIFKGYQRPAKEELVIASTPLLLLNITIIKFLLGLNCWYAHRYSQSSSVVLAVETVLVLVLMVVIAGWIWRRWCTKSEPYEPYDKSIANS